MGWNGSGTFTRSYDWTNERDADYKIDAAKFDTENDNFKDGINACLAKNGENAATADLPMGGFKHTGVGDGTALAHYPSIKQVQWGRFNSGGTSLGSANAQTITLTPAPTALSLGMTVTFTAGFTNTSACTLNPNGLGADNIQLQGQNLVGGEIRAGRTYTVVADGGIGTTWRLMNDIRMGAYATETSTPQNIGIGVTADLVFSTDTYDPDGLHSTSTNTERISTPIVGLWVLNASFYLTAVGGTPYIVKFGVEGATSGIIRQQFDATQTYGTLSGTIYSPSTTSYVTVMIENTSGSTITAAYSGLSATFVR